jgi:hypothetical protein
MLRQFAGLWIAFFGGFALWQGLVRGNETLAWVFGALALGIGPVGLVRPPLLRPIFIGWMLLAFPIGWTVSKIIMALVFYGLFTPLAIIFRLIGRDALALRAVRNSDTYWISKPAARSARNYFRQF